MEMVGRDKIHRFLFDVSMKQKRESGKIFFTITAQSNQDMIVFRWLGHNYFIHPKQIIID
jgi:hypothetical protein